LSNGRDGRAGQMGEDAVARAHGVLQDFLKVYEKQPPSARRAFDAVARSARDCLGPTRFASPGLPTDGRRATAPGSLPAAIPVRRVSDIPPPYAELAATLRALGFQCRVPVTYEYSNPHLPIMIDGREAYVFRDAEGCIRIDGVNFEPEYGETFVATLAQAGPLSATVRPADSPWGDILWFWVHMSRKGLIASLIEDGTERLLTAEEVALDYQRQFGVPV
jgi:hypothetical protein